MRKFSSTAMAVAKDLMKSSNPCNSSSPGILHGHLQQQHTQLYSHHGYLVFDLKETADSKWFDAPTERRKGFTGIGLIDGFQNPTC
ncbi:hypothetical protein FQR65_LT01465 [Abscondita terminalis]|nr:hypothetical protein FQR65_LT01465 [Abscondita terminalis]